MNTNRFLTMLLTIFLLAGCTENTNFYSDGKAKEVVHNDFQRKTEQFSQPDLFSILDTPVTEWEKEALIFLYAYMPIGDITDYDGDFYLRNVRSSYQTREEMPWGKIIPDDIFRHFVLPVRVNNENLDESRWVFYEELKDRVKNLSLYDAVLEVNHWCHEKVTYTPSDSRTSSPMASVKTAHGRCGEESTFTTAALRSVGIPARQVYTPRWAHTDDNHAWVEAWVDGQWYFLGACEPEPVLNMGWFNGPAYRGMLMHTKAFGRYNGPEEIMEVTETYTEINVTDNYAPTASVTIHVTDQAGKPAAGADVEFKIYNYASFYTVATKQTDANGSCTLSAGKGDMLVWVTQNGKIGYGKVSFGNNKEIQIILNKEGHELVDLDLEITPPVDGAIPVSVTEEQIAKNALRLEEENKIRSQYVSSFYTEEKAIELAKSLGLDQTDVIELMTGSRGNWREIETFLRSTGKEELPIAMSLLKTISAKDVRDTPASILKNHLDNAVNKTHPLFVSYILNPRVSNELLSAYRTDLQAAFEPEFLQRALDDPAVLVDWVHTNISVKSELNPQRIPVLPSGVLKGKIADTHSLNIFFVSVARSLGIPARIETVTQKTQYYHNDQWVDVVWSSDSKIKNKQGYVVARYSPIKSLPDPKYYSHFTISRIGETGKLQTLNFRAGSHVDMGLGNTWSGILKNPFALDEGNYMLVTGTRLASGGVLSHVTYFRIEAGKTTSIDLVMRESADDIQVIGSLDAEALFLPKDKEEETSILAITGRGYFIIGVLGARQEPTNHAMRDIAAYKDDFETWGRSIILLFRDEQDLHNFDVNEFGNLPETITYGIDKQQKITQTIASAMNLSNTNNLPVFVIADTFGRIVFVSQGYTIGLGEQMMKVIHKL